MTSPAHNARRAAHDARRAAHDGTPLLDLTGVTCPVTFARITVALEALPPGGLLEIILDPGEPATEVPRSVRLHGHAVEREAAQPGGGLRIAVRKR